MKRPRRISQKVSVLFYSGGRGRESPRALVLEGAEHPIDRILERRLEMDAGSGSISEVFICRAAGRTWSIRHHRDGRVAVETPGRARTGPPPLKAGASKKT